MLIKTAIIAVTATALLAPVAASAAPAATSKQLRYCVQAERSTGSRIRDVDCMSKADWAQLGVEVEGRRVR